MTETERLQSHFANLGFPADASAWLLDVWRCLQVFDDVADGDRVDRGELNKAIWACFVSMPDNAFFSAKRTTLVPVLATQILKWQASDAAERGGKADARSYMWRAGYYDVVLIVAALIHGPEKATELAETAMRMYGEDYADYIGEFN